MTADAVADLVEAMFDHDVKVEMALHLPTMVAGNPSSDLLEKIGDGDLDEIATLLGLDAEQFAAAASDDALGPMVDRLSDEQQWAVLVSAPQHGPWVGEPEVRSRALYAGWTVERWFLAATYEAALTRAVEWVASDPPELLVPDRREVAS